ncbi:MAG: 23S rRNA (guanosine(2251)-2'-O)-methyltransferase RlmB [Erysipelotrichaceae bacterium]|nr:23S rRNA (guanosine(2251)-2'-O)-methyltransferase RlmB [Erysipelotrichaceae bacterium]
MAQYVYGKNVVMQLLKDQKKIYDLYVMENSKNEEIVGIARKQNVKFKFLNKKDMDRLVNTRHQGVIAKIDDYQTYSIEELLKMIPSDKIPLLLMLDCIQDPHNLGAILRTCDAVGVDGVIIMKDRSVGLNPTVAKVSVGAIDTVRVAQVTNLTSTIKMLKKKGYWICGADNKEAKDYRTVDYNLPLVLVIGSEGFGISRLVKENIDFSISLPMVGTITSLNASVATGVLLYQIFDQRYPLK